MDVADYIWYQRDPMKYSIRDAKVGDEIVIHQMIRELAEFEKLAHEFVGTPEDLARDLFAPNPRVFSRLAVSERGEPLGFSLYFFSYSTFLCRQGLYLEDLYVKPHARGLGLGKALLKDLARIAMQAGCGRMEWAVLDWNTKAIALYESLGAEAKREWFTFRLAGDRLKILAES